MRRARWVSVGCEPRLFVGGYSGVPCRLAGPFWRVLGSLRNAPARARQPSGRRVCSIVSWLACQLECECVLKFPGSRAAWCASMCYN